jgi:hypothetical protein
LVDSLDQVVIPCQDNPDGSKEFKIEIIGGWFGFPLIELLVKKYGSSIRGIDFFEVDPFCCKVLGKYINSFGRDNLPEIRIFKKDYFEYKETRRTHLIINTSCEHMDNMNLMKEYYIKPERTLLVLQSNDKIDEPDHINCVNSTEELGEQSNIKILWGNSKTIVSGSTPDMVGWRGAAKGIMLKGDMIWWNRFMVMGKWEK